MARRKYFTPAALKAARIEQNRRSWRRYHARQHGYTDFEPTECRQCGVALPKESKRAYCDQHGARRPKKHLGPVVVRHIAGYVPPKGSIARSLFANVVNPIRGLHA